MKKLSTMFWEYMFYFSLFVMTVWLILKVTGVINTPVWLEYGVPIGSFILAFLSSQRTILEKVHQTATALSALSIHTEYLTKRFDQMEVKVSHLEKDVHIIKRDVDILTLKVI